MTTKVTSDLFKGLRNPYTGSLMEVEMTVNPGREPLFRCPDTYSTGDIFATKEGCLDAWSRGDGIAGARTGQPVKCAYTGKALSFVCTSLGWRLSGGFDPHMFHTRDEFLRFARMRNGVSDYVTGTNVRVTAVPRTARVSDAHRRSVEAAKPNLDGDKLSDLEKRLNRNGLRVKPGSVSMSTGGKRRGK